jgi:hypothetical protein
MGNLLKQNRERGHFDFLLAFICRFLRLTMKIVHMGTAIKLERIGSLVYGTIQIIK